MELTNWFKYSDFYDYKISAESLCESTVDPITGLCEYGRRILFDRKGVYLIAEGEKNSNRISLDQVRYVGHAGGVGQYSFFNDRIRKHGLKAIGCHIQNGCNNAISSSVKWRRFEENNPKTPVLDYFYVRFVLWPEAPGDWHWSLIETLEKHLFLLYHWLSGAGRLNLPPLNSQGIGANKALEFFDGPVANLCEEDEIKSEEIDFDEVFIGEDDVYQFMDRWENMTSNTKVWITEIQDTVQEDPQNLFYFSEVPDFRVNMPTRTSKKNTMVIRGFQRRDGFTVYLASPPDLTQVWLGSDSKVTPAPKDMGLMRSKVRISNAVAAEALKRLISNLQRYASEELR